VSHIVSVLRTPDSFGTVRWYVYTAGDPTDEANEYRFDEDINPTLLDQLRSHGLIV
jgi:hypothetical protein